MNNDHKPYTNEDHEIWSILMKQIKGALNKASKDFLIGLKIIDFPDERIPLFDEINEKIFPITGWKYKEMNEDASMVDFFKALSEKTFLATTEIRSKDELDFCKLPDVFHDLFGHAPMLTCKSFTDFLEQIGKLSLEQNNSENIDYLSRIYWYTAEVGLIIEDMDMFYYGGSILSSLKEINTVLNPSVQKLSYNIENVISYKYDSYNVNEQYFVINSYKNLTESLSELIHNAKA